ncbi:copper resistance protein CopZ [Salipiger aestuarii]|uniref:Copper chaperone NosL n=1 Tax=Salipiger aestuarii TaxID=568098 RepID=A0A327Y6D1_9RHOB|nr:nitrous oxide reductase accessory protein NosL [Salipiger aestuarii]KAB2541327.1 copper resistance protein CopZ [Salipiger aestuarii]RAK14009.1 copper chaperone NosL [Salipiger aestuarii]
MKRMIPITLILLALLAGCKEETADLPAPVEITAEAAGFYCQMALIEHDGPKAQIHLDGMPAPLFFSQVRDALAYLHMPEQSHAVTAAYVQDMTGATWETPGAWITAQAGYFVIGSDRMGGMQAPEFVPFATPEAAGAFATVYGGHVRAFDDIRARDLVTPAPAAPGADADPDMADRLRRLSSTGDGS